MVGEYFILYKILLYCMITLLCIWELIKQMVPTYFVVITCLVSNAFGCRLGHPGENMPAAGTAKTWNMNVFTQMSSVDKHVFMPTCGGRRVSLWAKSKATYFVLSCTQCPIVPCDWWVRMTVMFCYQYSLEQDHDESSKVQRCFIGTHMWDSIKFCHVKLASHLQKRRHMKLNSSTRMGFLRCWWHEHQ